METVKKDVGGRLGGQKALTYHDASFDLDQIEANNSRYYHRRLGERETTERLNMFHHHLKEGNRTEIQKLLKECRQNNFDPISSIFTSYSCFTKLYLRHSIDIAEYFRHSDCMEVIVEEIGDYYLKPEFYRDAMLEAVREDEPCYFHLLMVRGLSSCSAWFKTHGLHRFLQCCKAKDFDQINALLREDIAGEMDAVDGPRCSLMNLMLAYGCPTSCLKILIEKGYDVNQFDAIGLSPLCCAVLAQNADCLEFLLCYGSDLKSVTSNNRRFGTGKTALMIAASLKNSRCLEILLPYCDETDIEFETAEKWRAMTFACRFGNRTAVELLLNAGAKIEIVDSRENTTVLAAMKSGNADFLRYFLGRISHQYFSYTLKSSLDMYCIVECAQCVDVLISHFTVDLDARLCSGRTLLSLAASEGLLESVRLLLDRGATIDQQDGRGDTALLCASRQDHFDVVRLLVERGADVNMLHSFDSSAVMYAVSCENVKCLKLLLEAGANVHCPDVKFNKITTTVFTLALEGLNDDCLRVLLNGANIFQEGVLSPIHMNAIGETSHTWNNFSAKTLNAIIEHGLFSWKWCSPYSFRTLAFSAVSSCVCPDKISYRNTELHHPLVLAFMKKEIPMIKYFLANLYFFPEDYQTVSSDSTFLETVSKHKSSDLSALLDKVTHQPMTLRAWSFLVVSKAISSSGQPVGRAERVGRLPLPPYLNRRLAFQSDVSKLCPSLWSDLHEGHVGELLFGKGSVSGSESCSRDCFHCRGTGIRWQRVSPF